MRRWSVVAIDRACLLWILSIGQDIPYGLDCFSDAPTLALLPCAYERAKVSSLFDDGVNDGAWEEVLGLVDIAEVDDESLRMMV